MKNIGVWNKVAALFAAADIAGHFEMKNTQIMIKIGQSNNS